MPTFSYSPTDSVAIAPTGDVSVSEAGTTTTFSKSGATKSVTKNPPEDHPPTPEVPVSQKNKPNGDLVHTYTDITKTPPVTTRITFRANGDFEILVTIGQDRNMVDVAASTGIRRTKLWRDPDPEPQNWTRTDLPRGAGAGGGGSSGGKKPKKKVRGPVSAKRRPATRSPKKTSKKKARRR